MILRSFHDETIEKQLTHFQNVFFHDKIFI